MEVTQIITTLSDLFMDDEFIDYYPTYDDIRSFGHITPLDIRKKFYDEIYREYSYLSLSREGKNGSEYNHQRFFERVFYQGVVTRMIVLDEAGSGKSRLIITYLYTGLLNSISNVDLYNYINCGNPNINNIIYLANNESLLKNLSKELYKFLGVPDDSEDIESKGSMILNRVQTMTYHGLVNYTGEYYRTNEALINSKFGENLVLIVDEVHNLRPKKLDMIRAIVSNTEAGNIQFGKNKYSSIQAIYRLARYTNVKIVFLSASLIVNEVELELSGILTMLFGQYISPGPEDISQYNLYNHFEYLTFGYFTFTRASRKDTTVSYRSNMEIGVVNDVAQILSFTKDGQKKIYNYGTPSLEIIAYEMSPLQSYFMRKYNVEYSSPGTNITDESDSFYRNNNKLTTIIPVVYNGEDTLQKVDAKYNSIRSDTISEIYDNVTISANMTDSMEKLKNISTNYYNFILNLSGLCSDLSQYADAMEGDDVRFSKIYGIGAHAVYMEDIEGYGLNTIISILKNNDHRIKGNHFKFANYTDVDFNGPKFAIITSATTKNEREQILHILHSKYNHSGRLIKLVLFTDAVQGLNINSLTIHFLSFPWNKAKLYQSMYRIIRTEGLDSLKDTINKYFIRTGQNREFDIVIQILLYASYPMFIFDSNLNMLTLENSNITELDLFQVYSIAKYISVVDKNVKIDYTLSLLRNNSFGLYINNYRSISEDDFCIYNCFQDNPDISYNQYIEPIRSYDIIVDYSHSKYFNTYLHKDVSNNVFIPYFTSGNIIRDYYINKYNIVIVHDIIVMKYIYIVNFLEYDDNDNAVNSLELAISRNFNTIISIFQSSIGSIENNYSLLDYQGEKIMMKLDIIDKITNEDDKRILRNNINFWFIVREPENIEMAELNVYGTYTLDQLTTNMITKNTSRIFIFHMLESYINQTNNYSNGRIFLGYNGMTFRYKLDRNKWYTANTENNIGIYITNMYKLIRYSEMGIYMQGGNLFVLNYYKGNNQNYKNKYRYYYYPNIGENKKTMSRGNSSEDIDRLCINMVMVGMNPFEPHGHYNAPINKFSAPNMSYELMLARVNSNDTEAIYDYLLNYLESNSNNKIKIIFMKLLPYINGGSFEERYNFILKVYGYKVGILRNRISISKMLKHMEDYIDRNINNLRLIVYKEYHG